MAVEADATYMQRALTLAARGRGKTSPNPMVGAVIVKNGRIVGEGYHLGAGKDHAELAAIKKAGHDAQGGTLFVNLEPCCHTGLTGPCTEAIITAGIKKVVYAVKDPDPRVNGKGARMLKKAGVEVANGLLKNDALLLNENYLAYHKNRRPFVILKTAQTLDGRIATTTGDSKWISSPQSLKLSHRLRTEVDAVVIGMGTLRKDDPSLTVRLVKGRNPYRIVLSSTLDFPLRCHLLTKNDDYRTIIAGPDEAIKRFSRSRSYGPGLIFWNVGTDREGLVDLRDFIAKANEFGLRSLLVEGGGRLASSFLKAGLVDKYIIVIAPIVLGSGVSAVDNIDTRSLTDAIAFERYRFEVSGQDRIFIGYPKRTG